MKTTTTFMLFALLAFCQVTIAQDAPLSELLDRLHGNHMGSIHDVFSPDEIATLQAHFDAKNGTTTAARAGGGMYFRATENTQANSVVINSSNLSMIEIIAPSPLMEFEGAGATIPGTARAIVVDNDNNFYEVDSTGMYSTIGMIPAAAGQSFTGLEYASDGTLYGIATDGMGSTRLYQIDLLGGQAEPVGGDNGLVVGIALGRDMNNNLYSYDIDTDMVYRIDRLTGLPTLLGNIGFDAEFGQGMSYDSATDMLLATAFNSGSFKPELRSINTTTGASTLMGVIVPSATLQFAWMSPFDMTLGIDETSENLVSVFPNPANAVLTLTSETQLERIAIYNTLGQLVHEQETSGTNTTIDVADLASGLYLIQVTAEGASQSLRFVKN